MDTNIETICFDIKYIGVNKYDNSEVLILNNSILSEDLNKFFVLYIKDEKLLIKSVSEFDLEYAVKSR